MRRLRVLFAAAEIFPMAKTGGLGDVAAALPAALYEAGVDVRLVMPAYPRAVAAVREPRLVQTLGGLSGESTTDLLLGTTPASSLPIYLVRDQALFERAGGPYQDDHGSVFPDNAQRFATLCAAVATLAHAGEAAWRPDIIHLNDWHTGLVPAFLRAAGIDRVPSVLTIHNAAYQEPLRPEQVERFGIAGFQPDLHGAAASFLSLGIAGATRLTAVSPTYAAEIQTPEFGRGLERLIAARVADLQGILNGIDVALWNPQTDEHIAARYNANDLAGKAACKRALLAEVGWEATADPLLACVSRLTPQKGLDILLECLPQLLADGMQFVLLGTGDPELEAGLRSLAQRYPASMAVRIDYDEAMAHRIIAGADIFIMPSRFEPCGLNQMYSQRYGTIPVVHAVGGLADTVREVRSAAQSADATGFAIETLSQASLAEAVTAAASYYRDSGSWRRLQRNAMAVDFSWARSARAYRRVYEAAFSSG